MSAVYMSLSSSEVHKAILKAANLGGASLILRDMSEATEGKPEAAAEYDEDKAMTYLSTVSNSVGLIPWATLIKFRIGIFVKALVKHDKQTVRSKAVMVLCKVRSEFALHQASLRQ